MLNYQRVKVVETSSVAAAGSTGSWRDLLCGVALCCAVLGCWWNLPVAGPAKVSRKTAQNSCFNPHSDH